MECLRKAYVKQYYSKETNFLLDSLTLRIKDKEISKEYMEQRLARWHGFFWPQVFIYGVAILLGLYSYFFEGAESSRAIRPFSYIIVILI